VSGTGTLPHGWAAVTLEDVADVCDHLREPVNAKERATRHGSFPYYGATGQVGWIDDYRLDGEYVLLGEDGAPFLDPTKPKAYVISGKAWVNNHAHVLLARDSLMTNRYLLHALNAADYHGFVTGTTRLKLNQHSMRKLPTLAPPLPEQHRIVAKLEELFSKLDAGVAALKRVQANLKRYRASVLKAAVEGKLTEEWRAQHPDAEPASELLNRLLAERRRKWEEDQLARHEAKGTKPPKDWKTKYKEPAAPDTAGLPELPEGWMWSSIGQCFNVQVGATPSRSQPEYWGGDIPWASSGEVQFCRIAETNECITELGVANSSTKLNPSGSVLLGMIGEGRTRGQAAIMDIAACNNQNCAAIWVSATRIPPEFVYYWLWSQYETTRRGGSGNNQPALNKALVQLLPLPLPPLAEQCEVVAELDRCLSVVEQTESQANAGLCRAARLRQSLLKRAFEGKLVPQDPTDEPATALLQRITAQRQQDKPLASRPRRRHNSGNRKSHKP